MARHGENIRKRKDGRWEGRYGVYSAEKGKKVYRSVYGKSYEEARGRLAKEKRRNGTGQGDLPEEWTAEPRANSPAPGRIPDNGGLPGQERRLGEKADKIGTESGRGSSDSFYDLPITLEFTDVAREWLAHIKKTRKASTYVKYKLVFEKHLRTVLQDTDLSRINDSFIREQIPDGLTDSVQKSIYCVLNQILKFASKRYGMTMPVLHRPEGTGQGSSGPVQTFSRKEQRKLLAVLTCGQDLFKIAVLLCLYTGLRLGEVCAMRWEDLDFVARTITVNRTVQRLYMEGFPTKTVLWETEPKTEHSRREIPITDAVWKLLVRLQNWNEDNPGRETSWESGAYLFGGNKPAEPRTMQNHFKKILKEAGLENKNFHTLRHTFATNCIEGGTDVKSLSELLGHSDVQITLNRYVHPSMDTKRKHLDVLSSFYDQIHIPICDPVCGQIYGQAG